MTRLPRVARQPPNSSSSSARRRINLAQESSGVQSYSAETGSVNGVSAVQLFFINFEVRRLHEHDINSVKNQLFRLPLSGRTNLFRTY